MLKVKSDKVCVRFVFYIVESIRDDILEFFCDVRVLFVMFDGVIDCSVSEVEIVYCCVLKNG